VPGQYSAASTGISAPPHHWTSTAQLVRAFPRRNRWHGRSRVTLWSNLILWGGGGGQETA